MTHEEFQQNLPKLYNKIAPLLREKLERDGMVPFYCISPKMGTWMRRNAIRQIHCQEWHDKYINKTKPMPEGYIGILFAAKSKRVKQTRFKGNSNQGRTIERLVHPNDFYLEVPIDLCIKALALGQFS